MSDTPPAGTDATFCTFCGSDELELPDSNSWTGTDEELRFHYECQSCGGQFDSIRKVEATLPHETHTLQFVVDTSGDATDTPTLAYMSRIEADEDDMAVEAERAALNMQYGGCGEVQGPDWAIQQLYSILEHSTAFDEEISGRAGEWLDDDRDNSAR